MYEVALSRVERIEQRCSVYIRKWLGLPKMLNTTALYGKGLQLELPLTSIVEEYKAGKVRTVMMLRYSNDGAIRENPPEVRSGRKWKAEDATDDAISVLQHADIVGAVQESRTGFGLNAFKPFCMSSKKEKKDAVVKEIKKQEADSRYLHLVQCAQQGQCLKWNDHVVQRKLTWKEVWAWQPARTSFLIKSTYDVLPSPANLVRWKISDDTTCKCGKKATMKHILSNCTFALERYTWRHNQVLSVLSKAFAEKILQINEGRLPKVEKKKVEFHREGRRGQFIPKKKAWNVDGRWKGSGKWEQISSSL